jgi:hypothetical protein
MIGLKEYFLLATHHTEHELSYFSAAVGFLSDELSKTVSIFRAAIRIARLAWFPWDQIASVSPCVPSGFVSRFSHVS